MSQSPSTEPVSSSSSPSPSSSPQPAHLFVLVHGLWGGASHLKSIEELLHSTLSSSDAISDHILTIRPKTSALLKTYDGVEIIAKRMLMEVLNYINEVQTDGYQEKANNKGKKKKTKVKVAKISFVGYSLGGLVARHIIGQLESLGLFDHIEPYYYTSFASPHLGTWFFDKPLLNSIGSKVLGVVGSELFIKDKEQMLVKLSEGVFFEGLRKFRKRFAFANVRHDRSVAFYASYITEFSPFEANWDDIKFSYEETSTVEVKGQIVRPTFVNLESTRLKTEQEIKESSSYSFTKALKFTGIVVALSVILPWWMPLIFTVTVSGTVISHTFVKFWYRGPTEEELREIIDDLTKEVEEVVIGDSINEELRDEVKSIINETEGNLDERENNIRKLRERIEETTETIIESAVNVNEYNVRDSTPVPTYKDRHKSGSKKTSHGTKTEDDIVIISEKPSIKIQNTITRNLTKFINPNIAETPLVQTQLYPSSTVNKKNHNISKSCRLPLDQTRLQILKNLNSIAWHKFAIHLDVLNAHNAIVVRRGLQKGSGQGISVVLEWCGLIKDDLSAGDQSSV